MNLPGVLSMLRDNPSAKVQQQFGSFRVQWASSHGKWAQIEPNCPLRSP
jgi:hypothetical protein